ncbi:Mitochondrial import inner membrane translocase subunit Tim17 family protein [Histomonas meleagridis]|uniref:Mitochondrial import inner membrane translocase subunit Tim17 family protein n=1 Tax=Histomonas meleagridis TaxID=135588 RepID=UPI0035598AC1|nr:Mitochondrial import inner membrane translocase subunit Tim17 family protein [Histomonas meleagridis]KAH0796295.1 Mitochondrial import inner membrane translocase subunit Tim17 family protein [Histomonas meleagridis]
MSNKTRRPIPLKEDRKPIKFEEPEPNKMDISPMTVNQVARFLLPITPEEVLYRDLGQSNLAKSLGSAASMGALGFAIGSGSYAASILFTDKSKFSFKECALTGLKTGAQLGIEAGITQYIESTLACNRGKAKFYDKIIAGTTAGAILGIPDGFRGIKSGAAKGALYSVGMLALQSLG